MATDTAPFRKTTQLLMPLDYTPPPEGKYDIYPGYDVGEGAIEAGFAALARRLAGESVVVLDGFQGIFWEDTRAQLDRELRAIGREARWVNVADAMLPEDKVQALAEPFLGGDDPLFGTRFTGTLRDFFDPARLAALKPSPSAALNIIYGCGAALAGWNGCLVYVDLPKIEVQFRSRAGTVCNLGMAKPIEPKPQYKRFYFVDWVALNAHKGEIFPRIDIIVDGQRPDEPALASAETLRSALTRMSCNCFRVRPWFEPGPWGGTWILDRIPGLAREVPNYAWSFELIVPENGLLLRGGTKMLEVSFDFMMFLDHRAVLGDCADRFGLEFPIRFDFLDTFDGGNLSVQVHPREDYIRLHFGENFTQDETYYILDCKPGAGVYLGFQEGVDRDEFHAALRRSHDEATPLDVHRFVNVEPAKKHDLFLIPGGTIHGSGKNNLVLEISATTYIFTFKMYDWMRMDLDGKPRPLNIERAMDNLYFERQGAAVKETLVSKPRVVAEGDGWRQVHLPTHPAQFFDVHRHEFSTEVSLHTDGSAQVMSLVEGSTVLLETEGGERQRFSYAETFVVPAAARSYRLISENGEPLMVIRSFIKPDHAHLSPASE